MATALSIAAAAVLAAAALALWQRHRRLLDRLAGAAREMGATAADPVTTLSRAAHEERRRRHEAEGRLALFEQTMGRADFGILLVDPKGAVVFANGAARVFLGARHGDAVAGARIRELVDEVSASLVEQSVEVELYTPTHRYVGLLAVPLFEDGRAQGVALFLDDLSERHRVDAIRRDFVANASHELKTPLGAMQVLAETLASTGDAATRARLTSRLVQESARMARLVDDFLDLATLEGAPAEVEVVYLKDVLNEAYGEVSAEAAARSIPVEVSLPAEDLVVAGHRAQLVSAVSNLLDNAVKYTAAGTARPADPVTVRAFADGADAIIEVADHGIGIARSHQDRVFERFYRVDRARSRSSGGTGLGLAIVRHVAINHGGSVGLESTPGVGSTFRITLPRTEA